MFKTCDVASNKTKTKAKKDETKMNEYYPA